MKNTGRFLIVAALAGTISVPAVLAQSNQPAQPDQNQPNQDQYSGVAHPPPDSSIQADEDAQPAPAPKPKPSAAVPVAPAAAPVPLPAVQPENDYGIVASAPGGPARSHAWNADDDIVNVVPTNPNELGEGANIRVRLADDLSTSQTTPGTPFHATVARDVYQEGRVIIPAGSEMRGRVVSVSPGHHLGIHASMRLRPESVVLPDGTSYRIHATVVESDAPGTRANDEGAIEATNHYKKDAVEYGAAAGTGAIVGAVVAGPVGAGVGTLIGAGAVTTHMLIQDPQAASLPQGSSVIFSLTQPLVLTPAKN
jgi:hypothetical protein